MEKIDIIHSDFTEVDSIEYTRLSAILSADGLFCFIETVGNGMKIISIRSIEHSNIVNLERVVSKYVPTKVELLFDDSRFSLIPRTLFSYGKEDSLVRNMFSSSKKDIVFTDHVDSLRISNLYAVDLLEDSNCRQLFPGVKSLHLASRLIANSISFLDNTLNCIFIFNRFYIILYQKKQLVLCSSFQFSDANDVLYIISKVKDDFSDINKIILLGDLLADSKIEECLALYFSNVHYSDDILGNVSCFLSN